MVGSDETAVKPQREQNDQQHFVASWTIIFQTPCLFCCIDDACSRIDQLLPDGESLAKTRFSEYMQHGKAEKLREL